MIVKTDAIVLRSRRLRETSRFVTLYTALYGKIDVVAKGARQQKSKLRGVLEPFSEISAVIYRTEHRTAQYLSDAELRTPRRMLSSDYDKVSAAFAVAELTDVVMHHQEANPAMYALLRDTLEELDRCTVGTGMIVTAFQIRLIKVLGFDIQCERCSHCSKTLAEVDGQLWFSPADGGFRCAACGRGESAGTKISREAYNLLITIESPGTPHDMLRQTVSPAAQELRGLLNAYILHHTESRAVLHSGGMLKFSGS